MPEVNQEKPVHPSQLTDTSTINQPSANNKTQPGSQEKTNKSQVNKIDLPLDLLDRQANKPQSGDIVIGAQRIKTTLENFGIPIDIEKITWL